MNQLPRNQDLANLQNLKNQQINSPYPNQNSPIPQTLPPTQNFNNVAAPSLSEDKTATNVSLLSHLGTFLIGFFAPLLTYLSNISNNPFAKEHSKNSLNWQLSLFAYSGLLKLILFFLYFSPIIPYFFLILVLSNSLIFGVYPENGELIYSPSLVSVVDSAVLNGEESGIGKYIQFWIAIISFLLLVVLWAYNIIIVFLASIKARKGKPFKYPLSISFLK